MAKIWVFRTEFSCECGGQMNRDLGACQECFSTVFAVAEDTVEIRLTVEGNFKKGRVGRSWEYPGDDDEVEVTSAETEDGEEWPLSALSSDEMEDAINAIATEARRRW